MEAYKKIKEYKALFRDGVISEEEYRKLKHITFVSNKQELGIDDEASFDEMMNQKLFNEAMEKLELNTVTGYSEAISILEELGDWGSAAIVAEQCKADLAEIKSKEESRQAEQESQEQKRQKESSNIDTSNVSSDSSARTYGEKPFAISSENNAANNGIEHKQINDPKLRKILSVICLVGFVLGALFCGLIIFAYATTIIEDHYSLGTTIIILMSCDIFAFIDLLLFLGWKILGDNIKNIDTVRKICFGSWIILCVQMLVFMIWLRSATLLCLNCVCALIFYVLWKRITPGMSFTSILKSFADKISKKAGAAKPAVSAVTAVQDTEQENRETVYSAENNNDSVSESDSESDSVSINVIVSGETDDPNNSAESTDAEQSDDWEKAIQIETEDKKSEDNEIEAAEQSKKKKKSKIPFIIAGVVIVAIITAAVFFSSIYPGMQADKAYDEYISSYSELMDSAKYDSVSNNANALLEEHKDHLDDSQKSTLEGIDNYSAAIKMLDYTTGAPGWSEPYEAKECLETAMKNCDDSIVPHDLCDVLIKSMDKYNDDYHGVSGTLTVDHSKYDAEKEATTDDSIRGTAFDLNNSISFDNGSTDSQFMVTDSGSYNSNGASIHADAGSYKPKYGTGSTGREVQDAHVSNPSAKDKEEEKPVINEYSCSGEMNFGFRKKDKTKGLSADNIETIYILDAYLESTPEEEDICDQYKAVFLTDQTEEIEVKGAAGGGVSGMATYKDGEFKVDFGNGVVLNLSTKKQESESSGSSSYSGSSGSSSSSSSGSSSSSNKDYSPGSEWEEHDADKDGKISDDEYRDAVNDYMDDYYNEIGDGGNNLDAYDYNGDGEMGTNEFQDAVGDYMDSHGY